MCHSFCGLPVDSFQIIPSTYSFPIRFSPGCNLKYKKNYSVNIITEEKYILSKDLCVSGIDLHLDTWQKWAPA
jgi:hypothetical protein